ncbi:MAG: DUF3369 domain-containing protein [Spongiibacteraceae bacterium]
MSDRIVYAKERTPEITSAHPWKLLIVDDEEAVHEVTKLALGGFKFAGRGLQFISAYSGEAAKKLMAEHGDISVILLDVVMESQHAGLEVADYVRGELGNKIVRIVLRTGQPGEAPEYDVITKYDINDYKEKTELTQSRLYTTVYSALSAYRELHAREISLQGLTKIIEASANIFDLNAMNRFATGVLEQLTALLHMEDDALLVEASALAVDKYGDNFDVVAAIGGFSELEGRSGLLNWNPEIMSRIKLTLTNKRNSYGDDYFTGYYKTSCGQEHVLYASASECMAADCTHIFEMFISNVAIAHQNIKIIADMQAALEMKPSG